jgi:predicted transcriptional regulator
MNRIITCWSGRSRRGYPAMAGVVSGSAWSDTGNYERVVTRAEDRHTMSDEVAADVLGLTAQIVSAHIGKTQVAADALPSLIQTVYRSLATAGTVEAAPAVPTPAVPVKKSVFPDFIICLEDGKKLKMLKRHLKSSYDMTPDQYRTKWNLPADYPMVAPNYASHRSTLAKSSGLGRKRTAEPTVTAVPARRAKGSKG